MGCCRDEHTAAVVRRLRAAGLHQQASALTRVDAEGWGTLPKGWTQESVKKMWRSLTGDRKHKITACEKKMRGKVDNAWAFCASLARKVKD